MFNACGIIIYKYIYIYICMYIRQGIYRTLMSNSHSSIYRAIQCTSFLSCNDQGRQRLKASRSSNFSRSENGLGDDKDNCAENPEELTYPLVIERFAIENLT